MPWLPLHACRDRAIPKLHNLRRAQAAGLRVPDTAWAPATTLQAIEAQPPTLGAWPYIVRSGSRQRSPRPG